MRAIGIVSENEEDGLRMQEVCVCRTAKALRGLFVALINRGAPASELWQASEADFIEDLSQRMSTESASTAALREIVATYPLPR